MPKILIICLLLGILYPPKPVQAGKILNVFVDEQNGHYLIKLSMQLKAPKQRVIEVMTNYNRLKRLSKTIVSSNIVEQRNNYTKVKLVNEGCVLFICQTIIQLQNVVHLDNDYITVNVEPMDDNIKFGSQLWHFEAVDAGLTNVHYSADIVPDFWIPPLIGSWIFQNTLAEEATLMMNNAEKFANLEAAPGYTEQTETNP